MAEPLAREAAADSGAAVLRVTVIGGGISGLTAAFLARAAGHQVVCVDPGPKPGGLIQSERHEGFLCEAGPQALLDDAPDSRALITAVGLDARAVAGAPEARRRFLYSHGALQPVPMSPPALLRSGLLSPLAKLRLLAEPLIPARRPPRDHDRRQAQEDDDDAETVEAFGVRRLGRQATRTLLGTGIIGIYAADASLLSISSAFPRIVAMERQHGSLLRGMLAARKAGRSPGRPLSFRDGLGELPAALGQALGQQGLTLGRILAIEPGPPGLRWRVLVQEISPGAATRVIESDAVILAVGTDEAARILGPVVPAAREALAGLPATPVAVCCLGFRAGASQDLGIDLAAYGFLVARGEGQPRLLGCQYESSIFPGRTPPGGALLRAILGGAGPHFEPDIVDQPDARIVDRALADLKVVTGLKALPDLVRVWKYPRGIPRPAPGLAARVSALDRALQEHPGLFVIGHGVRGVGVNESIRAATALISGDLSRLAS